MKMFGYKSLYCLSLALGCRTHKWCLPLRRKEGIVLWSTFVWFFLKNRSKKSSCMFDMRPKSFFIELLEWFFFIEIVQCDHLLIFFCIERTGGIRDKSFWLHYCHRCLKKLFLKFGNTVNIFFMPMFYDGTISKCCPLSTTRCIE